VIIPIRRRNRPLKGCHFFATDRRIKAKKLKGGPGSPGTTHPTSPIITNRQPITIRTINPHSIDDYPDLFIKLGEPFSLHLLCWGGLPGGAATAASSTPHFGSNSIQE
jgi:hypothetical protein